MEAFALKYAIQEYRNQVTECGFSKTGATAGEEIERGLMMILLERLDKLNNNLDRLIMTVNKGK